LHEDGDVTSVGESNRPAWPGGSPVDAGLAAALAILAAVGVGTELANAPDPYPPAVGGYLLAVAAGVPLLFRRRAPVWTAIAVIGMVAVYHLLGYPGLAPAVCLFVAIYSAALYAPGWRGWMTGIAAGVAGYLLPTLPPHRVPPGSYAVLGPAIGFAWILVVGVAARIRRLDSESRVRDAAAMASAQLQQRLAEERLTIARELHDVLAHSMSIIAVQSGAALDAIDTDVASAKKAMLAVRDVAKRALPDLRGALTQLRDGGEPADLAAQPRLTDIADLVERVRGTGLDVALTMPPRDEEFTPLTELAAYRIVQEALTNVVRHAGARSASVTLRRTPTALLIDVVDDGHGLVGTPAGGLGLAGMHERAALVAGTVKIANVPTGSGTSVHAQLPAEALL
jgi:signal transduction histidine kinase